MKAFVFILTLIAALLARAETVKPIYSSHFVLTRIFG